MTFAVRYVPISPGTYNRALKNNIPDLDLFVPVSEEVLITAKKNIEDFFANTPVDELHAMFPLEHSHDTLSPPCTEPIESPNPAESEEYLQFLREHDMHQAGSLSPVDGLSESSMDSSDDEDMCWDFSQDIFQQQPEGWDATSGPDLEALIASTEFMDPETLDCLRISLEELDAVQKSIEVLERSFLCGAVLTSDSV